MDFDLPETARELADLTRRILADHVTQARLREIEAAPVHFDANLWHALGGAGVLGAALPASVGGGDAGFLGQCAILHEIGRAVAPVPYLWHVTAAAALAHFGTDEQRARWATPAATGSLVLTAALAEDLADNPEAPLTRAERVGDGWRLTGVKSLVAAGGVADAILVPASTDDAVVLFLVRPDDPGVTLVAQQLTDGDQATDLELTDVPLDADRLVPGADAVHWLVSRLTVGLAAYQVGVLEQALELTAAYAREREQFGRPIGSFQAVGQRLADAYIDVEATRLTMWEAAWRITEGLPSSATIATAKFWAADAGHRVAHTAVHVHGGTGIDMDAQTHRYFTAAKRTEFTLGSATAQLLRIGAELADTPV
ncbi:MAG: acyl-CoA dehydrogenase family protein [Jatrophihabitans sp.]